MKFKNVFGYFIGVVGIILSIYFYFNSVRQRIPIFKDDPARIRILYSNNISKSTIKVFKANGQEVKKDLSIIKIYFWNNGKESIKPENILSPIIISKLDSSTNILEARLTKISRPITGLRINYIDSLRNEVIINFKILEKGDGGMLQLMYEGDVLSKFIIKGTVEGFGDLSFSEKKINPSGSKTLQVVGSSFFSIIIIIIGSAIFSANKEIYLSFKEYKKDSKNSKVFISILQLMGISLFSLIVFFLAYIVFMTPFHRVYLPDWIK